MSDRKCLWILIVSLGVLSAGCAVSQQGGEGYCRIDIRQDENGQIAVALENEIFRADYRSGMTDGHLQTYIRELLIKDVGESQGHWLDGAVHRTTLKLAVVIVDRPEVKTVRMVWDSNKFEKPFVSEVSVYPGKPYLKIYYEFNQFGHVCDLGRPGGVKQGQYVIYGAEPWQKVRQGIDDPALREHENEHHRLTDDLYPIYPHPLIDQGWGETPMNYHGWYILGLYNPENGRGFGRVVPADVMHLMKLLWGKGFEFFPHWKSEWRPYTTYLFVVRGGEKEILELGKQIADMKK